MTSGKKRFERSDDNWLEDEGSGNKYGCRKINTRRRFKDRPVDFIKQWRGKQLSQ